MGGWGSEAIVVNPHGDALPCHSAATLPGLTFENVRTRSLADIWFDSSSFNRFRGTEWMTSPCRECPLGRQETDFGGCRCQAFHLTGTAEAADPTCHLSPAHDVVRSARSDLGSADGAFVPRATRSAVVNR
jgi:pyrroloquinoline quinone biosynthesis protein E